ncbi:MAG: VWA domain-containing protein [Acidimicrobiia bacterium]
MASSGETFAANLVHFVRYLRSTGVELAPDASGDLAMAAKTVGLADRTDVYHAFKAISIARAADVPRFDEAFELFFGFSRPLGPPTADIALRSKTTNTATASLPALARQSADSAAGDEVVADIAGGSYAERLATRDFATLTSAETEEIRRLLARMIWRPADASSRRWVSDRRGDRPHIRKTFSNLTRPDGDLIPFEFKSRRPRRRPLLVLADISGSMELYTEMFLYFIHAAQSRLGRVEAFVFATRLSRITREIRHRDPRLALRRVVEAVDDWSGGTRIGETLADFNKTWSRRVTRGGAVGLIISDGWDTGDPELLDTEMARFARSVRRVVWLNPLAGRAGYAPEARGMRTVLPYVDDFLAAASLVDLRQMVQLLESLSTR